MSSKDGLINSPGQESIVRIGEKILDFGQVVGKKMDASAGKARLLYSEFVISRPGDEAHDSELGNMFDLMFEKYISVKTISICFPAFYSVSKVSLVSFTD